MHNISSMYLLDTKYTAYQGIKFIIITFHAFILYRTPPRTRYGAAGGVYPGSTLLYVSLGFAGERFFDTFILDTSTNQWSTSKSYNPCPVSCFYCSSRTYSSMALLPEVNGQKRIVLYGGIEKNRQVIQAGSISETSSSFSFLLSM